MNVLMVGAGLDSWQIRGVELGAALGARVTAHPRESDWRWADVAVLVKRAGLRHCMFAHRYDVPIVWDTVDFWQQPAQNSYTAEPAIRLLQSQIDIIKPALTIGATQAEADACGGVYLPHHARPNIRQAPIRDVITTVAYDGNPIYLGRWADHVRKACDARGWRFVLKPTDLSTADVIVAFRDGQWDGWMCRQWKSGVKLVNAMAAGRPILSQPWAAFDELQPVGTVVHSPDELDAALEMWTPREVRARALDQPAVPSLSLAVIAERYRQILETVRTPCRAA
jgi:hypothetical protein